MKEIFYLLKPQLKLSQLKLSQLKLSLQKEQQRTNQAVQQNHPAQDHRVLPDHQEQREHLALQRKQRRPRPNLDFIKLPDLCDLIVYLMSFWFAPATFNQMKRLVGK